MSSIEIENMYVADSVCSYCGEKSVYMCDEFDALFCIECDRWLERRCGDPNCEFCSERPPKPSGIPYIRSYKHG